MITKEIAVNLKRGQIIHHKTVKNADGSPARYVIKGAIKTWKRAPERFQIPVKRGMYEFGYVTEENGANFVVA